MSERSTFVSEAIGYFADRESVAADLMAHLASFEPVLIKSAGHAYAVAGVSRSSWAGGEWEDFNALPVFEHDVSVVINCDSGAVIRFNLKTREFANVG